MRPLVRMEKRGKEWAIILRSGRIEFADTCYAKVAGVFDYLESRRKAQQAQRLGDRESQSTSRA